MQRLFSTFPGSWPGLGLLILRWTASLSLITDAPWWATPAHTATGMTLHGSTFVVSGLLGLGFYTPYAAAIAGMMQVVACFGSSADIGVRVVAIGLCAGLGMTGPGAWSIDARVFGRKRIVLAGNQER